MSVQIARRYFTVAEYHRMGEAGIISEEDRVELIEGEVLRMSPIGSLHAACVKRVNRLLGPLVGQAAIVSVQDPIQLDDLSEPEPDVALLQPRDDFYARALPTAADVLLIVEVSDTSLEFDRDVKVPIYARARIPQVLIVNLLAESIEAYSDLQQGVYQDTRSYKRGESIALALLPGVVIKVDDVLGP